MIEVRLRAERGTFLLDAGFEAPEGVTALFGTSGAGKTSIIDGVAGLMRPDGGRVRIGDRVLYDSGAGIDLPVRRRKVGYVFQDGRLFPHMTVRANLRYGGRADEGRVIDMLGLEALLDRRPATLSGGERQRVALGRALMAGPRLLLLDEPLAALDEPRKAAILPYLERLRDGAGVPILYVTHDAREVARLATTLVIVEEGRVRLSGPVADVLADPAAVPVLGQQAAGAVLTARVERHSADGLTHLSFSGGTLVLPGKVGLPGDRVRVRVPAQDVILALDLPARMSALNAVSATVTEIAPGHGPGVAVGLLAGEDRLLARITRASADRLGLEPGQRVHAILKATAVAPQDVSLG